MKLIELVETSQRVAATRARGQKIALLADCIRRLGPSPDTVMTGVSYLAGELPQGRIGVGYAQLAQLRGAGAGRSALTLQDVDQVFTTINAIAGAGAARRRNEQLAALFSQATASEQEFLLHLVIGGLRHGALAGIALEAVARAYAVPSDAVRKAVMLAGSLPAVAAALAASGASGLDQFELALFRPLQPMLADTVPDVDSALQRLGEAAFEFKLDGARVQVHKDGDRIEVYTRNLNAVTNSVPEIVATASMLAARRLVLDGEAIALAGNGRPLPFQETMRRFGRKLDVERLQQQLPLRVFFFDALRIDDDTLIDRPLAERWHALEAATQANERVTRIVTARSEAADAFFTRALEDGHEGLMAKSLASRYSAGRRGSEWLKLKSAHTLDLVVLAAEWGSGRREGWLSNLHLGARDADNGGLVMLGKTFKGMTDEVLRWQTEALLAREVRREGHVVYVRPELVGEFAFNDVQISPQYPGGVALRFARLKHYRLDKGVGDVDTIEQVRALLPRRARD